MTDLSRALGLVGPSSLRFDLIFENKGVSEIDL